MHTITSDGEVIDYERDPSTNSDANLELMYNKLQSYNQTNRTNKTLLKRSRKIQYKCEIQKQRNSQAQTISNILKKVRRNNIIQQFVNKLKMNIILRNLKSQDENEYFSIGKTSFQEDFYRKIKEGKIHKVLQNQSYDIITIVIKFFTIIGIFYINSLKIAFQHMQSLNLALDILIVISILLFMIELTGMLITVKKIRIPFWKNFIYWAEKQYLHWQFILNFCLFLELFEFPLIVPIIVVLITPEIIFHMKKFKKVENSFVLSINFQRYWQLFKIVLFNFCIAHILSIILNLMGSINLTQGNNWYAQKNINHDDDWFVKYIWGYYWGTNIMLTVGFGDISAQNHIEALILIFIQTIACMIMAYNISQVSKILQNISEMDQQKKIKFKVFNQMGQKYFFQDQFKTNILNHIDKSIEKKHELTYIQEKLIQQLPQKIKLQVKREVNKYVFQSAYFFKNLTRKTQNMLAEKVNKIFSHPQQIILKNTETWKILILRQGSVALTYKKGSSPNNGTIIERFCVQQITKPQLLSLKFIRKIKIKGDLKSLDFSILNALQLEHFESILKQHDLPMFQFYCSERDKTQYHQFDLQIRKCTVCVNSKHDKIQCPRMHFIPLRQHVIYKKKFFSRGQKVSRNQIQFQRKMKRQNSFRIYRQYCKDENDVRKKIKPYSGNLISSFQIIGSTIADNVELTKKLDKCIQKLDQGLKIMKGIVDAQELEVDLAYNYKRYFLQHNPDNLSNIYGANIKGSLKITSEKKMNQSIL